MNDRAWTAAEFDYSLPSELIAQRPSTVRGESRLLVVDRTEAQRGERFLRDRMFAELPTQMAPGDLLVVNDTRVRHARLLGQRPSGAPAEVLLIHPSTDDTWIVMGSPGRALQPGRRITLRDDVAIETVAVLADGTRQVRFVGATAAEAIAWFGQIPLPPYIDRDPTAEDAVRYQTVYARREGSVAAPTAGLHLTGELLDRLREHGVEIGSLDLEVGPGTFRPLDDGPISAHTMHAERFEITDALAGQIAACRAGGGKVWAVGTTVVRALESAALDGGLVRAGCADTQLMIAPGYHFRVTDRLVTNFHLPRSTLLMLVAAFAGYHEIMAAYRHAVHERYRFYSYGDAMLITGDRAA